jgi:hypothetical protein
MALEQVGRRIYLNPTQIFDLASDRMSESRDRDAGYRKRLAYYYGRQAMEADEIRASDSSGKPLLRYGGEERAAFEMVANKTQPIADDFQAILGRLPRKRVDPMDESDPAKQKARTWTRYLLSTDDLSRGPLQQAEAGFFNSVCGDSVYVLDVIPELRRVAWSVVNPLYCYPSFKRAWERFELYDLAIVTIESDEALEREFGFTAVDDSAEAHRVITYHSPWQRSVVVGDRDHLQEVHAMRHDLGFCLARWHYNKFTAGMTGMADIAPILALQDYYNFNLKVLQDGLVEMTYPVRMIKGAIGDNAQIPIGPGETLEGDETGDIVTSAPTPHPTAGLALLELTKSEMLSGAGTTPVRAEGDAESSIPTGKAIHAIQGPQATRIDLRQALIAVTFSRMYAMILQTQELAPFLKNQEIDIFGREQGRAFRQTVNTKEIDGWYQVTVTWEPLIGMSKPARVQMAIAGMASKLWGDFKSRDIAGVEDPEGEREEIANMLRWEHGLQMEMQQGQPGGQPGQPGAPPGPAGMTPAPSAPGVKFGGQSAGGAPGGGGGGPGEAIPFRPPTAPLQSAPGPRGVPQGVTITAVENALRAVAAKLKGTVFVVGELAHQGMSMKPELRITDWRDYRFVKEALKGIAPMAQIKYEESEEAMGALRYRVA